MRALLLWTFIALFPLYWTLSTSFKLGRDVTQGHLIPWVDFMPSWKGWQSLGLSPDTIFATSNVRDEFLKRFVNSVIASVGASASGGRHRLARRLWAEPLRLQVRPLAQQGHLVLLPVAADPAAGRARDAVPRSLQGAGAARYAHRPHPGLYADGAADRHLGHARPVRHDPDRDGAGRARRWLLDLGRVPPHRPADRAARHGRGVHPVDRPVLERIFLRLAADRRSTPRRCR